MTYHYRHLSLDRLKIIIDNSQTDNQGSFLEYVRREKAFIIESNKRRGELESQII
jgi:hypothetical protein